MNTIFKKIKRKWLLNWKNYLLFFSPFAIVIPIVSFFIVTNIKETDKEIIIENNKIEFPEIDVQKYRNFILSNNKINEELLSLIIKDVLIKFSVYDTNLSFSTKIENERLAYIFFKWEINEKIYSKNLKLLLQ